MDLHIRSRLLDLQEDKRVAVATARALGPPHRGLPAVHQPEMAAFDFSRSIKEIWSSVRHQHGEYLCGGVLRSSANKGSVCEGQYFGTSASLPDARNYAWKW